MHKISKIIILTVFILSLSCLGIFVFAGTDDNVFGFAYSENIGWLSFNSVDCDIDGDGVFEGAGETGGPAPAGCPDSGTAFDYGISVDLNTGALSGFAYSENIGWVSFNQSDLSGCPSGSCRAKVAPSGQIGKSDVDIQGWARACAGSINGDCTGGDRTDGWDGWIKFDHGEANEPYIDAAGDWHGWAWGSDVVGWLSFNGVDPDAGGSYKVTLGQVNRSPSAINLSTTASVTDYCSQSPANIFLNWEFSDPDDGDSQSAYQVQVTRINDGQVYDSGKLLGSAPSRTAFNINSDMGSLFIWYDSSQQGYTWQVKVWDSQDAESEWSSTNSFNTPTHQYPSANTEDKWFTWSPLEPSADEDVQFTDESVCYVVACTNWDWDFESDDTIDISGQQNPIWQFTDSISHQVTLWVTDADGNTCPGPHTVGVQVELPGWKEILPQ